MERKETSSSSVKMEHFNKRSPSETRDWTMVLDKKQVTCHGGRSTTAGFIVRVRTLDVNMSVWLKQNSDLLFLPAAAILNLTSIRRQQRADAAGQVRQAPPVGRERTCTWRHFLNRSLDPGAGLRRGREAQPTLWQRRVTAGLLLSVYKKTADLFTSHGRCCSFTHRRVSILNPHLKAEDITMCEAGHPTSNPPGTAAVFCLNLDKVWIKLSFTWCKKLPKKVLKAAGRSRLWSKWWKHFHVVVSRQSDSPAQTSSEHINSASKRESPVRPTPGLSLCLGSRFCSLQLCGVHAAHTLGHVVTRTWPDFTGRVRTCWRCSFMFRTLQVWPSEPHRVTQSVQTHRRMQFDDIVTQQGIMGWNHKKTADWPWEQINNKELWELLYNINIKIVSFFFFYYFVFVFFFFHFVSSFYLVISHHFILLCFLITTWLESWLTSCYILIGRFG